MAVTEAGPRHQMENALHHRPRLYQEEVFGMAIKGNVSVSIHPRIYLIVNLDVTKYRLAAIG